MDYRETDIGRALQALALLLHYPGGEVRAHAEAIGTVLQNRPELTPGDRDALAGFLDRLGTMDLLEQEADYVATFEKERDIAPSIGRVVHRHSNSLVCPRDVVSNQFAAPFAAYIWGPPFSTDRVCFLPQRIRSDWKVLPKRREWKGEKEENQSKAEEPGHGVRKYLMRRATTD